MAEQRDDRDREESDAMATESKATHSDDPTFESHKRSYQVFMRLLGYSTAGVAVVLILLAIFLL